MAPRPQKKRFMRNKRFLPAVQYPPQFDYIDYTSDNMICTYGLTWQNWNLNLQNGPLEDSWTLWYLEKDRFNAWEDLLNEVATISTIEDFWYVHYHIRAPSEVKWGSDFSLFRQGIRPMWEDPANIRGGRWVICLYSESTTYVDAVWFEILMRLIGETFEFSNEICGAVVNIRQKGFKVSVWTADGNNESAVLEIGVKLYTILSCFPYPMRMHYDLNMDNIMNHGHNVEPLYVV